MNAPLQSAPRSWHRNISGHTRSTGLIRAAFLCSVALAVMDGAPVSAQASLAVGSGTRVRVTVPDLQLDGATGTVLEATNDSVRVLLENPRRDVAVERDAITEMDVSVRRHRNTMKGLGLGLLIGGVGGAVLGLADGDDPSGQFLAFSASDKAVLGGVLLGVSGAVIGLVAGSLTWRDVWAPVKPRTSAPPDVSVVPFATEEGTGLRLGLSIPVR